MNELPDRKSEWRRAAVDRWYAAQDHVGQADTDPEPYIEAAADAAVRVALEITDEMVTAALSAYHYEVDKGAYEPNDAMRAALEAAFR